MPRLSRILCIEDNPLKFEKIERVVRKVLGDQVELVHAQDQYQGERHVDVGGWDLVLLDISLDIRAGGAIAGRGGHDYTGGLKIAGRMFYYRKERPTIIITGFDAFPSGRTTSEQDVILGLEDVEKRARKYLADHLVGTVRYGPAEWEADLGRLLAEQQEE